MLVVHERRAEKVSGKRTRDDASAALEWAVLESGVLAVKTPLEVATAEGGMRCIWFDPRTKQLVCPHGWGQYHLGIWNGPRAADFPKPAWISCDCKSATGLCSRQKRRAEVAPDAPPPSYYETLVATVGVTELRPGLVGARGLAWQQALGTSSGTRCVVRVRRRGRLRVGLGPRARLT